ncbi:O-antigen ligase family protein [Geodermatophilus sp. SYSU D00814]
MLYFSAVSVALLLGLFIRSVRGVNVDFPYGVGAVLKFWVALAYFSVFAFYSVRLFREGGRLLRLWVRTCSAAALTGTAGSILHSQGVVTPFALEFRATGGFDDPNLFASYLLIGIALTFVSHSRRELRRPYAHLVVQATALLLTGSRAAIPALVLGLAVALILGQARRVVNAAIPWLASLAAASGAIWLYWPGLQLDSVDRLAGAQATVESDVRLSLWSLAWRMWLDNPLIGVGIGQFRAAASEYANWPVQNIPHSTHLSLLAETGLPGYALVMGIPCVILIQLSRLARTGAVDSSSTWLMVGVACSLAVAFTLNIENSRSLWAYLGVCLGYIIAVRRGSGSRLGDLVGGGKAQVSSPRPGRLRGDVPLRVLGKGRPREE